MSVPTGRRQRLDGPVRGNGKIVQELESLFRGAGWNVKHFRAQRERLGGSLPQRRRKFVSLQIPPLSTFQRLLDSTGDREISTTMAFVQMQCRCLALLCATR